MKYFNSHKRLCIPVPVIESIISGGAGVVGSAINAFSAAKDRAAQKEMFYAQLGQQDRHFYDSIIANRQAEQRQRQYAAEDFERETQYNSPSAQRARYEAAGLNPALMMQGQNAAVGQIEATSSFGAPSIPSPPSIPQLSSPDYGAVAKSIGDAFTRYSDSRIKEEQIEALGVENQFKRLQLDADLTKTYMEIDNLLADSYQKRQSGHLSEKQRDELDAKINLMEKQKEEIEQRLNFNAELHTYEVNQRKQDVRMRSAEADEQEANAKIADIEASFRDKVIQAGLKLSSAQIAHAAAQIKEISERINDMNLRRRDDYLTAREKRNTERETQKLIRQQAAKLVWEVYHINPNTAAGKKRMELIEKEIKESVSRTYNNLRVSGPFGIKLSHPVTWFSNSWSGD